MAVVLSGISKTYSAQQVAVKDLNLEIEDGEFFTLLGPSGCGKTTTLRMIAGLEQVTSGSISIRGRDVTTVPARYRDVAMVFQSYALYPHMSVRDNLALNLKVKKIPRAEVAARVQQVAAMLGIEPVLDRRPGQLSGGQRQRVALGRAIIRRPNVFLMDEPLSNLDLKLREQTRTELKKLHEELRITTVYVTHDQSEALVLSDRIGVMNEGELLQVGGPHEVYARPANIFVAQFIGSPSINLLEARVRDDGEGTFIEATAGPNEAAGSLRHRMPPGLASGLAGRTEDGRVTLGVRPEDLVVHRETAPGRLPAQVDFVQPMGSVSHAILRVAGAERVIRDRDHLIATIGMEDEFPRGTPVWVNVRGSRCSLFSAETGQAIDST